MVPLTKIKAGYTLGDVKINHLFLRDDLKVYGKNKAGIGNLASTDWPRHRNGIWDKEMWCCVAEVGEVV